MFPLEVDLQRRRQWLPRSLSNAEYLSNSAGDESRITDWRKLDKIHAILKLIKDFCGYLETQPRLARAGRTSEGQQPGRFKHSLHFGDLTLASNERGSLCGEIGQI